MERSVQEDMIALMIHAMERFARMDVQQAVQRIWLAQTVVCKNVPSKKMFEQNNYPFIRCILTDTRILIYLQAFLHLLILLCSRAEI